MATLFRRLENHERPALAPARAVSWKGALSVEEFARRNERLYAHPFGQSRMRTYGLFVDGKIAASLDAIQVALQLGDGRGGVSETGAWHLASVLTLPECRGQGLGSQLIRAYFESEKPVWSTLFSGIGPAFYEAFGYRASYVWAYSRPALARPFTEGKATEVSIADFIYAQQDCRRRALQHSMVPACAFHADALWWDWYADIYQYFGQVRGYTTPPGRFWKWETGEETVWLGGLENRAAGSLDLWWSSSISPVILDFLACEAGRLDLKTLSWWSAEERPEATPKREVPMIRQAADPASRPVLGTQMGDWW